MRPDLEPLTRFNNLYGPTPSPLGLANPTDSSHLTHKKTLTGQVLTSSRGVTGDSFTKVYNEVSGRVQIAVSSNDMNEKLGALQAMGMSRDPQEPLYLR